MSLRKTNNPFYILSAIAGVLFVVTACGYGLLMVQKTNALRADDGTSLHPLMQYLDENGLMLIIVELIVLGVATVAAMATDDVWEKERRQSGAGDRKEHK